MRPRRPLVVGWVLGLLGVVVAAIVLGMWVPNVSIPLPGIVPPKLRRSVLVDRALLAGAVGPSAGALYAGYAATGPIRGLTMGYVVSLAAIWLAAIALPAAFFLAAGASALLAVRPTLVVVYALALIGVLVGGLLVAALLAVPGGLWGIVGAALNGALSASDGARDDRP